LIGHSQSIYNSLNKHSSNMESYLQNTDALSERVLHGYNKYNIDGSLYEVGGRGGHSAVEHLIANDFFYCPICGWEQNTTRSTDPLPHDPTYHVNIDWDKCGFLDWEENMVKVNSSFKMTVSDIKQFNPACDPPCIPRPMMGRSWWKCKGYESLCGCCMPYGSWNVPHDLIARDMVKKPISTYSTPELEAILRVSQSLQQVGTPQVTRHIQDVQALRTLLPPYSNAECGSVCECECDECGATGGVYTDVCGKTVVCKKCGGGEHWHVGNIVG
jgi:hypothetical protein